MTTKHTPELWGLSENINSTLDTPFTEYCVEDAQGAIVGIFRNKTNAQLIAAAPELLEALENMVDFIKELANQGTDLMFSEFDEAEEIIKKAKGVI